MEPSPPGARRSPWRPPGLQTLWGLRILGTSLPPHLTSAIFLLAGAGVVYAAAAGASPGEQATAASLAGFLSITLPVVRALTLALVAVFAWAAWMERGGTTALTLLGMLPAVALLGGGEALATWQSLTGLTPGSASETWARWLGARLLLAIGFQLAWAHRWVAAWDRPSPARRLAAAVLAGGAWLGVALLAAPALSRLAASPRGIELGDGVVLALLAAAGATLANRQRQSPNPLTHAALVSLVPQIGSQLAALTSGGNLDTAFLVAEGEAVLANFTLLAGVVLEFLATQRDRVRIEGELRKAERGLQSTALEVARIDQELSRELAEKRRYESRSRLLDLAVQRMSLGLTIADPDGRIVYVNPADAAIHGYTPEELLGQSAHLYSATPGNGTPPLQPVYWQREGWNRSKDGRVFPVRLISDCVPDEDGRPQAIVTLCEDISEVRRAHAAVARRDRVLTAVGLAAERFLSSARWAGEVPRVLAALGEASEADEVLLALPAGVAGPEELLWCWTRAEGGVGLRSIGEGSPSRAGWSDFASGYEFCGPMATLPEPVRLLFGEGGSAAVVPVASEGAALGLLGVVALDEAREWPHGEVEALWAAARTLGAAVQREQVQAALARREAAYRQLIDGASDLIQSVGPDGRYRFVNPAWQEVLGYSQEEVAALSVWNVIDPAHLGHCREVFERLFREGRPERVETVFRSKAGAEIQVEGSVGLGRDEGAVVATIGIFRDVTERRRLERMKQEFFATVSHELRTPLTSMLGALGLLRGTRLAARPERVEELLEIAERNGDRLLRLINDLLDLQRLQAGELRFQWSVVSTGGLLEEAVRGIQGFADLYQVRVRTELEAASTRFITDRDRLGQVLYNLLSNAIKFSPAGEEVLLSSRTLDHAVELTVRDRGPGIPEPMRGRLFERFTQAEMPDGDHRGGSGLGLSISKRLVEGLGGTIAVDSAPGEGTAVRVALARQAPGLLPIPPRLQDTAGDRR